ncbi:dTDP-4-dehydrorhamnose reductase family protein [Candidatus Methylomicrobium oryzae]|jgi:dTDP-4-dehydrorhamnose reductase|uniref:dTDP-4-dehydrorhamnose reductase family protein n=1 Tax=Candidatus Methylomicrobium oryzae TaxID=2802053 RepID=UPI0019203F28|nr:SDR family oxidoreductase [Methylomicrobium sp. RS1]MBL1263707.1 SDR family oxidoreductase [Methylomicrobium sp. RS1]
MSGKVLVLGATGMLGNAVFRYLSGDPGLQVWGTLQSPAGRRFFAEALQPYLLANVNVLDFDTLVGAFEKIRPNVVINCIGLIKQLADAKDPLAALPINAMLPHRLAKLCALSGARLIHVSTDCVFSGRQGMYLETDPSDAEDLYGKSKYIGELHDVPDAVTLRTSIIGRELSGHVGLVDWFLSQEGRVKGYRNAVFSGLPTVELARIMRDFVIPNPELSGLYHVSAAPIDKYALLKGVAEAYGKTIEIVPDDAVRIDRSLDSTRFRQAAGYAPPAWPELIMMMKNFG